MTNEEEALGRIAEAIRHTMRGSGPASVRLHGPHGAEDGAVVLIFPGPLGIIIDDALDRLYALLGWRVDKEGRGEVQ